MEIEESFLWRRNISEYQCALLPVRSKILVWAYPISLLLNGWYSLIDMFTSLTLDPASTILYFKYRVL